MVYEKGKHMNSNRTKKIVFSALMASLTAAATMIIHIPSPFSGYIHLGDGLVLLSGMLLGPLAGAAAGGIGSMMADLLSGYAFYAPATLIIKGLAAFSGGYFIFELAVYGLPAAASNVTFNLVQNLFSLISAGMLLPVLLRVREFREFSNKISL